MHAAVCVLDEEKKGGFCVGVAGETEEGLLFLCTTATLCLYTCKRNKDSDLEGPLEFTVCVFFYLANLERGKNGGKMFKFE